MKVYICDTKKQYQKIMLVHPESGLIIERIFFEPFSFYTLKFSLSYSANSALYNALVYNDNYGILIESNGYSVCFEKDIEDVEIEYSDILSYQATYKSSLAYLRYNPPVGSADKITTNFYNYVKNLCVGFNVQFDIPDFNDTFQYTEQDNLYILKELCKAKNFSFRDNGVFGGAPNILITRADSSSTRIFNANILGDNNYGDTKIIVNRLRKNSQNPGITHLYAYAEYGAGSSGTVRTDLRNYVNKPFIDPNFPIQIVGNKAYIVHARQLSESIKPKYDTKAISTAAPTSVLYSSKNPTPEEVAKRVYEKAVSLLRESQNITAMGADVQLSDILLPMDRVKIKMEKFFSTFGDKANVKQDVVKFIKEYTLSATEVQAIWEK